MSDYPRFYSYDPEFEYRVFSEGDQPEFFDPVVDVWMFSSIYWNESDLIENGYELQ